MNHYQEAERLLAEAEKLWETPKVGVAKTLATMAGAHAALALALVKATRQCPTVEPSEGMKPRATVAVELAVAMKAVVETLAKWNGDGGDASVVVESCVRYLRKALDDAGSGLLLVEHDQTIYRAGLRAGSMGGGV